jgi:hypothetical protein
MTNLEIKNEILDNFIPQIYINTGKIDVFQWRNHNSYVEVAIPTYKRGTNKLNMTYILTNTGKNRHFRTTSLIEYSVGSLRCMLNVLNRS